MRLRSGEIRSLDLTGACLERIQRLDAALCSFLYVAPDRALEQARRADRVLARWRIDQASSLPPLTGIPVAVKDVLCLEGMPVTAGSRILEGFHPPYTATSVRRLIEAGAIVLGKTNTDEFAMGSSTENSSYGVTHNPWDLRRVPGGSSGGSAAAVAASMCFAALGSDTGGSIRQPAAFCGLTGLKTSYGRVSRYGLIAYGSSLDTVGGFARSAADLLPVFQTIAGHDPLDSTSLPAPVPAVRVGEPGAARRARRRAAGVLHRRHAAGGRTRRSSGGRGAALPGRLDPRDSPAAHRPGAAGLLPDRSGGGLRQPRAL